MDRIAFARARAFLDYSLYAKWAALLASLGTALLYVAFLFLLGLFVDVVVHRGEVPSYEELPPPAQEWVKQHVPPLAEQSWPQRLRGAPKTEEFAEDKIAAIMTLPYSKLAAADQVQRAIWLTWWQERWKERLHDLGLTPEQAAQLGLGPQTAPPHLEREIAWRWAVCDLLHEQVGKEAADLYRGRMHKLVKRLGPEIALTKGAADCGLLSLVTRLENRWDGGLIAWLATLAHWTWAHGNEVYLGGLLVVALLLAVLRGGLSLTASCMAAAAAAEAATRLRRAVYHHTFRLGTLAFRALGPAEAVSVTTRHLEAVQDALYIWLTAYFREPIKFVLLLTFALLVNFWFAMAFALFAALVWMIGGQIAAHFRQRGRRADQRAAEQLALLQESLMLMRLVKVYLMEVFHQNRVERQLVTYQEARLERIRGEALYQTLFVLLGLSAMLVLLYVAGVVALNGQVGVTSSILLAAALASLYLPMLSWLEQRRLLRRGRSSAVPLFKFLDRQGSVGQLIEAEFLPSMTLYLEFDKVSLKEPGTERKLLHDVTLTVQAGQQVAIIGPDPTETHAIVYLLTRFLDPTTGEIRIDRRDLRWVTLDSLRTQIAIVLQNNLIFNDTVANNIGCGDPSATLPRIIDAAKTAHAHKLIQKLPQGYDTPIGEQGHALNASEQYRIALARAILRDPALLILEEPTGNLDEEAKALLDDTMTRITPGRTVIFLPHRLSTIKRCDRLFLLHEGRIVASGEHKELLATNDLYRHLHYLEFNEFSGLNNHASGG